MLCIVLHCHTHVAPLERLVSPPLFELLVGETPEASTMSRFSPFPRLPPELRNRLWRESLPDKDRPALFPYKEGCWCPYWAQDGDEKYQFDEGYDNVYFEFRQEMLDPIQVDVPLASVNREARSIALAWAAEQGIELSGQSLIRRCQRSHDAMYIPHDKWSDFLEEPYERRSQPDLEGRTVSSGLTITQVAVPEELIRAQPDSLADLLDWLEQVRRVYIIVGEQPDFQKDEGKETVPRWQVNHQSKRFIWNSRSERFISKGDKLIGDEEFNSQLEKALEVLGDDIIKGRGFIPYFEVWPVCAVRG